MTDIPASGESDTALIGRCLNGDEGAFRALYARHTPRLRMVILRMLGRQVDETEDVLQETWLDACRGMHRYEGDGKFSSWLVAISVRAAYRRFGSMNGAHVELGDHLPARNGEPATTIDLERALDRLPPSQRAVVLLHDLEGFTHEEIGRQLGMTNGNSKVTLFRARAALREWLDERGSNGKH